MVREKFLKTSGDMCHGCGKGFANLQEMDQGQLGGIEARAGTNLRSRAGESG